jgi:hypothetical protein
LSFFHDELDNPNPTEDLDKKLHTTRAFAEKQIVALIK